MGKNVSITSVELGKATFTVGMTGASQQTLENLEILAFIEGNRDKANEERVMALPMKFTVEPIWQMVVRDLGINPIEVLKRAELPFDLFRRKNANLTVAEYFRLWNALEAASDNPTFPLKIGSNIPVEAFIRHSLPPCAAQISIQRSNA